MPTGKYTQKLCWCLLEYHCFRLRVVRKIGWHGGQGGGEDRSLSEETVDLWSLHLLLHVLTCPQNVAMTVSTVCFTFRHLWIKWLPSEQWLAKPLTVWKPFFSGHSQLAQATHQSSRYSSSSDSPVSTWESRMFWVSASSTCGNLSPVTYGLP
jgi:hypothetical protein